MSVSHHGDEQRDLMKRFIDQANGRASRQYSQGRMGAEDDGVLAYAIAADPRHRTIVIRFGKPTEWIGLGIQDAETLIDKLREKIVQLRTGEVTV